jgi:2-C-methyl-D-erythritol 4-phosphate cytidylyltransferase
LLLHSLDALAASSCGHLIVVVPGDTLDVVASMAAGFGADVVAGGVTRQESVARGLERVTADRVVIHDAARPFVTARDIDRTVALLDDYEGAVVAVPVEETLKRVSDDRAVETLDRTDLWRAQTPQAFRVAVLRAAHARAAADGFDATDDAQLLERYGGRVAVVRGSRRNLKLTFAEDFAVAEAMLSTHP